MMQPPGQPAGAGTYLRTKRRSSRPRANGDAQVAAANEAIKIDPTQAACLTIKSVLHRWTIDAKPEDEPGSRARAYLKYLETCTALCR